MMEQEGLASIKRLAMMQVCVGIAYLLLAVFFSCDYLFGPGGGGPFIYSQFAFPPYAISALFCLLVGVSCILLGVETMKRKSWAQVANKFLWIVSTSWAVVVIIPGFTFGWIEGTGLYGYLVILFFLIPFAVFSHTISSFLSRPNIRKQFK